MKLWIFQIPGQVLCKMVKSLKSLIAVTIATTTATDAVAAVSLLLSFKQRKFVEQIKCKKNYSHEECNIK